MNASLDFLIWICRIEFWKDPPSSKVFGRFLVVSRPGHAHHLDTTVLINVINPSYLAADLEGPFHFNVTQRGFFLGTASLPSVSCLSTLLQEFWLASSFRGLLALGFPFSHHIGCADRWIGIGWNWFLEAGNIMKHLEKPESAS